MCPKQPAPLTGRTADRCNARAHAAMSHPTEDRRGGEPDQCHRGPDQSAGAQCHHRGGARRRGRQGLRGGRQRGQVARDPDREGHRGDHRPGRRHPVIDPPRRRGDRASGPHHRRDQRDRAQRDCRDAAAERSDRGHRAQRHQGGRRRQRRRRQHQRRRQGGGAKPATSPTRCWRHRAIWCSRPAFFTTRSKVFSPPSGPIKPLEAWPSLTEKGE